MVVMGAEATWAGRRGAREARRLALALLDERLGERPGVARERALNLGERLGGGRDAPHRARAGRGAARCLPPRRLGVGAAARGALPRCAHADLLALQRLQQRRLELLRGLEALVGLLRERAREHAIEPARQR